MRLLPFFLPWPFLLTKGAPLVAVEVLAAESFSVFAASALMGALMVLVLATVVVVVVAIWANGGES